MTDAHRGNGSPPARPDCFADDDPAVLAAYRAEIQAAGDEAAARLRAAPIPPLPVEVVEHLLKSMAAESDPVMRRWYLSSLVGPGGAR